MGQHNPSSREGALLCSCNQRVEDKGIAMKLVTPDNIRKLQRKLYCKAKQESNYRFYALYDKVCRPDILEFAYKLCRSNKGAAGIDGITFEAIEANEGVEAFLGNLHKDLSDKSYRASPVRRVYIPKGKGEKRGLGLPTIRDRVAQMAVKLVIEPIFEADFSERSYGFRPKKSAQDAAEKISYSMNCGYTQVIDADLSKYFDTIPHAKLLKVVAERIVDGAILSIIKQWLKAPIVEETKDGTKRVVGGGKKSKLGTPQGGVVSPLLANIYLNLLDRIWDRHNLDNKFNARLVRYADDFVILCQKDTKRSHELILEVLSKLELSLNKEKTKLVDTQKESLNFLGFAFRMRKSRRTNRQYAHVEPSKKSAQKIKAHIKHMTRREMTLVPLGEIIKSLNQSQSGWFNYFHFRNCSGVMEDIRSFTWKRLFGHMCKRHKLRRDGKNSFKRFGGNTLYERYGLFKMPTTAGWTAHASR